MASHSRTGSSLTGRLPAAVAAASIALAVSLLGFGGATASAATTTSIALAPAAGAPTAAVTTGWLRLAHLSPDTSAVDIRLSALAGGTVTQSLSNIGYGAVSAYMALSPGTYVVAMVPTGGDFTQPIIQTSVTVVAGQPLTVAAFGKNADLRAAAYRDDLTTPPAGQSRVRVVQASTIVPTVSVATSTGRSIATDVAQGVATDYASVPGGPWKLDLTAGAVQSTADVDLAQGSISTLFVLDNASGGLALKPVLDSSSAGDLPVGGVQTGAGGTALVHASAAEDSNRRIIDIGTGAVSVLAAAIVIFGHRRRTRLAQSSSDSPHQPQFRRLPESYQKHDRQWYDNLAHERQEREREVRGDAAAGPSERR
ncbi:hypothetical protein B7R22_01595 [Subtercola boreus]|uniref:DUF4397 domain-containing protein n=1 Tax=Subtercola boreus TaxID=120213 RepID=A0A3E0W5L5_9MICO|nr:DUF4397 domain-containing protein [Subtercola boreus]RFA17019.1 hypothetical protein B7R22_01595 [Subtercola boreus]